MILTEAKTIKTILLEAADHIDRRGLSVGSYQDRSDCLCAVAAIRLAVFGTVYGINEVNASGEVWDSFRIACETLAESLVTMPIVADAVIISWSDESDKKTVIDKMREVAEGIREGH